MCRHELQRWSLLLFFRKIRLNPQGEHQTQRKPIGLGYSTLLGCSSLLECSSLLGYSAFNITVGSHQHSSTRRRRPTRETKTKRKPIGLVYGGPLDYSSLLECRSLLNYSTSNADHSQTFPPKKKKNHKGKLKHKGNLLFLCTKPKSNSSLSNPLPTRPIPFRTPRSSD